MQFLLDSAQIVHADVIRARFTRAPKSSGGTSAERATTLANWTITGISGAISLQASTTALDDSEVIDLQLFQALAPGVYTVAVASTVLSADGRALVAPFSASVELLSVPQDEISKGATNSSSISSTSVLARSIDRLNKFLNPLFRGKKNWDAVIEALATGDSKIYDQAEKTFDQLFLSSASGPYLTTRAADRGIQRPPKTGMIDETFRKLATSVINSKLTQSAFLQALEGLYGIDAVSAFAETSLLEPFSLSDGATLNLRIDERTDVDVVFNRAEFGSIRRATSGEVASAITRAMELAGSGGYASTKGGKLRIYSGSRGLNSSIRIISGTSQIYLRFPENRFPGNSTGTWTITPQAGGKSKISCSSDAFYNLRTVEAGDYISIIGQQFSSGNRGSFTVEEVLYRYAPGLEQYVIISNPDATSQVGVVQLDYEDISIFEAKKLGTYSAPGYVIVNQYDEKSKVNIPATTVAVNRNGSNAAYLNTPVTAQITALTRDATGLVTVTTATPHGLLPGSWFEVSDFAPILGLPPVSGAVPSGVFNGDGVATGISALSCISQWSTDTTYQGADFTTAVDLDEDIILIGGNNYASGVPTAKNTATIFKVRSQTVDLTDQIQHTYQYVTSFISAQYNLGTAVATSDIATAYNVTRFFGGYPVSPWSGPTSVDVMYPTAGIFNKLVLQQIALSSVQFDNAEGILAALGFWLHTNAVSGDLLSVFKDGTTRTYGFGVGGNVTVTIGGTAAITMTNLIAAINGDGPALWKALALTTTLGGFPGAAVALAEETIGASKSTLRIWGNAGAASRITTISYATATQLQPDYSAGTSTALPSADPGSGRAGINIDLTGIAAGRTHEILGGTYRRWTGAVWTTAPEWFYVSGGGTMATPIAEAKATWMGNNKFLVTGGITKLNKATAQVQDCSLTPTWTNIYSLKEARCQHAQVKLNTTSVLVIGGRRPADDAQRTTFGFTSWDFDDAYLAANFTGPVSVGNGGNTRIAGKIGYGVDLTTATMTSTGGGPQTTLNTALLADYTVMGWMTPGVSGCVFRNGIAGAWATTVDNTLLAFGIDSADDTFWIRFMYGSGVVVQKKTTLTVAELMSASNFVAPYPRYHHFAIVKAAEAPSTRFTLYINGIQAGTWLDVSPSGGSAGLWSFSQTEGPFSRFTGCIDSVGLSATVLTADQIKSIYLDEIGVVYDNPNGVSVSPVGRVLNTCEIAPITTGPSIRVGSMADARFACGVVKLDDGRILVCGGIGYNPSTDGITAKSQSELELKSVEIYDPVLQIWNTVQSMKHAHSYCSVGYFPELRRVYISGGFTSTSTEYLDLDTMTWETSTAIPTVRAKSGGAMVKGVMLHASGLTQTAGLFNSITSDITMSVADEEIFCGGLNDTHEATTGTTGSTIKFMTPKHPNWTTGTTGVVTAAAAAPGEFIGPFIFDPHSSGKTTTTGTLQLKIEGGAKYSSLKLGANEALQFPNEEGHIILNWGYSNEVVVKYLGRIDTSTLAIDAGFRFPVTSEVGASVRLLVSRSSFTSRAGAFYLTASNSGLAAARKILEQISATGIDLEVSVRYPGDRGLGGAGRPTSGIYKISDIVEVFGSDDLDTELEAARE